MIGYIIEVIICSGLFLVAYRWLLARKVSFGLCRTFIIASMLLAVAIPAMNVPLFPENAFEQQTVLTGFDFFEEELEGVANTQSSEGTKASEMKTAENLPAKGHTDIRAAAGVAASIIYVIVALASLGLTVYNIIKIQRLRRSSKLTFMEEYTLAEHVDIKTPFSFLLTIFMGFNYEPHERQQILTHEASHVRHRHSFERLTLSILRSVFWFNPFFWMAEKDLEEVHPVWEDGRKVLFMGLECSSWLDAYFTLLYDSASVSPFNKKAVEYLIASLCSRASDACRRYETESSDKTDRQFALYEEFIDKLSEAKGKHNVSHYAELLNISSNYLSRIVSMIGGGTAIDMINRSVILKAKVLLKNSDMTIENISEELNFPNSPYFCRFFLLF